MPIQDLTPQLRTRLNRMERAVGWFITIATILLLTAFAYYVYSLAERKGWFKTKVHYSTGINNVTGLKVGDSVRLMGYPAGQIYSIEPNPPDAYYGVTVKFNVNEPYYGYILTDSKIRVVSELLGTRFLEVLKGYDGAPTVIITNKQTFTLNQDIVEHYIKNLQATNPLASQDLATIVRANQNEFYLPLSKTYAYWINADDSPSLNDRLEAVANKVEHALPNILGLTNQITSTLTNASGAAAQLQATLAEARITLTNLSMITSNLRDPNGSLGTWLLPTNLSAKINQTLASANSTLESAHATLDHTDTNMTMLVESLDKSLINLANLTSNLNSQVQANTNMLTEISTAIVHTDELVQGLKRHWLLRSAFKKKPEDKVKK